MISTLLMFLVQASGASLFAGAEPLPDAVLAEHRGGIRLPNGIDLALTVQTQTAVNGAIVLRTEFRLDQGAPQVTVLTPRSGDTVAAPAGAGQSGAMTGTLPTLQFDRFGAVTVLRGAAGPAAAITAGGTSGLPDAPGLQASDGSVPLTTDNGLVTTALQGANRTVNLQSLDYSVTHLVGGAFGSAVVNMGNDRTIATDTTLSIDLRNAGPDVLGSTMMRVDNLVTGALAGRL